MVDHLDITFHNSCDGNESGRFSCLMHHPSVLHISRLVGQPRQGRWIVSDDVMLLVSD